MMIIHEESESPREVIIERGPKHEAQYIMVQNHVRELPVGTEKACSSKTVKEISCKKQKPQKKKKKTLPQQHNLNEFTPSLTEHIILDKTATEISESDLDELRTVYKKCKEVLTRIETKYGHLLNFHKDDSSVNSQQRKEVQDDAECTCNVNKKIIFGDDGQEIQKETVLEKHICVKNLKRRHSDISSNKMNVQVEYNDTTPLPDDLKSLSTILQDPNISLVYRTTVINKMKIIRQDYMNDIKFHKFSLIKKLKSDPDEALDFKGTNLASLPGYPDWTQ